jgi:hypothetical protein
MAYLYRRLAQYACGISGTSHVFGQILTEQLVEATVSIMAMFVGWTSEQAAYDSSAGTRADTSPERRATSAKEIGRAAIIISGRIRYSSRRQNVV